MVPCLRMCFFDHIFLQSTEHDEMEIDEAKKFGPVKLQKEILKNVSSLFGGVNFILFMHCIVYTVHLRDF